MRHNIELYEICFSHRFSKLDPLRRTFTSVRWLDKIYKLGQIYRIVLKIDEKKICLGTARLMRIDLKMLNELNDVFTRMDADCKYSDFLLLMRSFYLQKMDPLWKGDHSEIQILYFERISSTPEKMIQEQLQNLQEVLTC